MSGAKRTSYNITFSTQGTTTLTNTEITNSTISTLRNTNLISTNISGATVSATTFTGGSLSLSGNLNVAGTLTTVNITSTNLVNTNVSAGIVVASTLLSATGNSNTIGNIFTTGGNVGIGTTSPSRLLSLSGPNSNSVNGPHIWINTSDSPVNPVFQQLNWSANNVSLNFDMYYDGLFKNSNSSTAWQIYKLGNQMKFMYQNGTAGSSNGQLNAMVLGSTGNVGIGTTSPVYALDVNGTIDSTSLTTGAVYSTNITSTNIVGTNISAGTLALSNINVSTATIANLKSTNISTNSIIIDNNNNSNGIQIGVGTGNTTSNLNLYGSFTDGYAIIQAGSTNNNSPNLKIVRMTTVNGTIANFHVYSQTSSFIGGNVGIGTTTPGSVLDIVSSTPLITLRNSSGGDGKIYFGNGSHGVGRNASIGTLTHGNDVTLWTNGGGASIGFATSLTERMRITDVGNVGIGITSPTEKLHVVGNIKSTGSIDTDIQFLGQASDSATGPSFSWTGDTNTGFYRPVADTLGFVTNGAERIRVVSTGNVGIGTTSPAYTLDVTGSFRLNSTAVQNLVIGSTSGTANHSTYLVSSHGNLEIAIAAGAASFNNSSIAGDVVIRSSKNLMLQSGQLSPDLYIATSGNIGIGCTAPTHLLNVGNAPNGTSKGSISINNIDESRYHLYNSASVAEWIFGQKSTSRSDFTFSKLVSGTETDYLTISTGGNVGIGTTSPTYTLDVTGTCDVSTSITTAALYSTNITSTNIVGTNISSSTLNLSTGLTSSSAQITNTNITTATVATLLNTNAVSTNVSSATLTLSTGLTSASAQITNANVTTSTISTLRNTNAISTNITSTNIVATNLSAGALALSNINVSTATIGSLYNFSQTIVGTLGSFVNLPKLMMYGSGDTNNPLLALNAYDNNIIGFGLGAYINTSGSTRMSTTSTSWLLGKNSNGLSIVKCDGTVGSVATQKYILHFATNGNVGVGTTSPGYTLDVNGTTLYRNGNAVGGFSENQQLFSWNGSATYMHAIKTRHNAGANDIHNALDFYVWQTSDAVTSVGTKHVMSATSVGVGIGTTNPSYTLDVVGTGRFAGKLTFTGAVASSGIDTATNDIYADMRVIRNSTSSIDKDMYIQYNAGANSKLNLYSNNTQTMVLNGGNVGIGTTSPDAKLQVDGPAGIGSNGSVLITGRDSYGHSLYIGSVASQKRLAFNNDGTIGNIFAYNYGASAAQNLVLQSPGGNVGIGTNSPTTTLDVIGTVKSVRRSQIIGTGGSFVNSPKLELFSSSDLTHPTFSIGAYDAGNSEIAMGGYLNTSGTVTMTSTSTGWSFQRFNNNLIIQSMNGSRGSSATGTPNVTVFASNGNVAICNSQNSSVVTMLSVGGTDAVGNGALQIVSAPNSHNGGRSQDGISLKAWQDGNHILQFYNSAGVMRGSIAGSGSAAVAYNTSSDIRLKENVTNLNNAIDIIKQMRPVEFTWKSDNKRDIGFIAQEVYQILPEMRPNFSSYSHCECNTADMSNGILCECPEHDHNEPVDNNGNPLYYGLDYGKITPYLTKALQETINELQQLKQDFEEYKNTHP